MTVIWVGTKSTILDTESAIVIKFHRFQEFYTDGCYGLKPLELDNKTTLVLSNTRELDREFFYKLVYLL